jgi:branched-chain amino acid transport system substrate-binding protein
MNTNPKWVARGGTFTAIAVASTLLCSCASQAQDAGASCGDTLKLGILTAFTGEIGEYGEISKNAFDMAVADIEASGALPDGWSIETVVADEKSDIEEGLRAATAMMQQDKVSAILGPSSGPIIAMADVAERYKTPIISQFAGTTNFSSVGGKYLFRTVPSDASDGAAVAEYLTATGVRDVAIIVQNDQTTITAGRAAEEQLRNVGVTVKKTVTYNPGQPSYQSVVQQAISENAEAIYLAGGQESATTILKEMRDLGFPSSKLTVSSEQITPALIESVGAAWANGLTGVIAQADRERPQYVKIVAEYKNRYGTDPGPFVENAYDAVNLVALAAVAANSTCGEAIAERLPGVAADGDLVTNFADGVRALGDGTDIDYDGASGPVDFDETGTVAGSYAIYEVRNGKWEVKQFYPAAKFTK